MTDDIRCGLRQFRPNPGYALAVIFTLVLGISGRVSAYDPIAFAASILLLLVVGLLAAFVPTLRIAKIDPADTLRSE